MHSYNQVEEIVARKSANCNPAAWQLHKLAAIKTFPDFSKSFQLQKPSTRQETQHENFPQINPFSPENLSLKVS